MAVLILRFEFPTNEWHTSNSRMAWPVRYQRNKLIRERVHWKAVDVRNRMRLQSPVFMKCHVTVLVAYPTNRRFDPSNTSTMVKPILDELTRCGYWPDDDSTHLIGPDYRPDDHKSRPGWHEITLLLTETE